MISKVGVLIRTQRVLVLVEEVYIGVLDLVDALVEDRCWGGMLIVVDMHHSMPM